MQIRIVEWKEQVTQSGIQLSEITAATKYGELLDTSAYPAMDAAGRQGVITILTVRKFDDNKIVSMPAEMCTFVAYADTPSTFINDPKHGLVEKLSKQE